MLENEFISENAANAAMQEPVSILEEKPGASAYSWYMDSVLSEAEDLLDASADEIMSGGYHIHTGLHAEMQNSADNLFADSSLFPPAAEDGTPVQASLTVMDPRTGEIRAVIGGRNYEVRRGLNRATQIKRQPGSVFKPVSTYAAAIDSFYFVPSSIIDDTPRTFSGNYVPGNAGGANYGLVTLREALSRSLNIATVDLADLIGTDSVRSHAERFGFSLSKEDVNLSLSLGFLTDGVSPVSVTAAYCALANGGMSVEPHFITRIEDSAGRLVYSHESTNTIAVKDSTAFMITDMLKTAASEGSAKALSASGIPVAGKTGTIEDSYGGTRDIWTVSYTPDIAVTAWMGFDNPDRTHSMSYTEGGSGYPARLCAAYLKEISPFLSGRDFDISDTVATAMIDILALTNDHEVRLITEQTPRDYAACELFIPGKLPDTFSDYWTKPEPVQDFSIISGNGKTPVLSLTASNPYTEYALYRHTDAGSIHIATLKGQAGETLSFHDTGHDLSEPARYTVIPINILLKENGEILSGDESPSVNYSPGGILGIIKGAHADNAAQAPEIYDAVIGQPLFG